MKDLAMMGCLHPPSAIRQSYAENSIRNLQKPRSLIYGIWETSTSVDVKPRKVRQCMNCFAFTFKIFGHSCILIIIWLKLVRPWKFEDFLIILKIWIIEMFS